MTVQDVNAATRRQNEAADPARSTWLTANAGSGKTRVLTDRVARLLLHGTRPERILCLTYTKAAAAEMQNRLLSRLGEWSMLPDAELTAALQAIGAGAGDGDGGADDLAAARRLFARAIETPGGLKVQTIHAFCSALLRRFPLEAGVPVGFAELDDRSAAQLRAGIIEEMAREAAPEMDELLEIQDNDQGLEGFLASITSTAARFDLPPDAQALWAELDLPHPFGPDDLLAEAMPGAAAALIGELIPLLETGSKNDVKAAERLSALDWTVPGLDHLAELEAVLLTGSGAGEPFTAKIGKFPTKGLREGVCAPLMDRLEALMRRVEAGRERRLALAFAQRALKLHRVGYHFNQRYAAEKRAHGWLDFDDLINHTARLLSSRSMAQWVLFRLDGGIDHVLVDEAQDTSPSQWDVIAHLTAEFTAGLGTHEPGERTLFVVGDPKQSIYSFQGADIDVFADRHGGFEEGFARIGAPMQDTALEHSFRSAPLVLDFVDRVFAGDAGTGLGGPPLHHAFHVKRPGRVDLWPAIPKPEDPPEQPWDDFTEQPQADSHIGQLAEALARQIGAMIGMPITGRDGQVRPVDPGDILILVQKRGDMFNAVIRACKAEGLPLAGPDRLFLHSEIAVGDIMALLKFLDTPEDDLSLAEALRSPLFGLDEETLWRLAADRKGTLWEALRDEGPAEARDRVAALLGVAGYLRPYELISHILGRHGGREALLARLGMEAEDGINELLSQALAYESVAVPSLTGFLVWLDSGDTEVRRQPGGRGLIRVMTVHGAKGLESPIVILPDCAKRHPNNQQKLLTRPDGPAIWSGTKDTRPEAVEAALTAEKQRQEEERRRLLYVAMTRAESWLVIAAAGDTGSGTESWHAMAADGFDRAVAEGCGVEETLPEPIPGIGPVRRLGGGAWSATAPAVEVAPTDAIPPPEPAWLRQPVAPVRPAADTIAATGLGGAKIVPGGAAGGVAAEDAMLRGTRLHLLLEQLPDRPRAEWSDLAGDVLAGAEGGLPEEAEMRLLLDEVEAVVTAPRLAELFTLRAGEEVLREVSLTAPVPDLPPLVGTIDRLVIGAERIAAIDYKSNAIVPDRPEDTPEGLLRQMAAYRTALTAIWPDRQIDCALLWTAERQLMWLPDAVLDAAWGRVMRLACGSPLPG